MARIRTIKPEFFLNEQLAALPPHARLLFVGLWTQADREGRLHDRPARLKATVFPYEKVDVHGLLEQLRGAGFIVRYVAQSTGYIAVVNFARHQYPHIKEPPSTIPAPDQSSASTILALVEPVGREGKGKEGNGNGSTMLAPDEPGARNGQRRPTRAAPLPEPFDLTEKRRAFALEGGLDGVPLLFGAFKDHHRARGTLFRDWEAAWRSWCRKELAFREQRQQGARR